MSYKKDARLVWVSRLATIDKIYLRSTEMEAGVAYVIGYVDKTEHKKNQT